VANKTSNLESQRSTITLSGISELVFLDRYALKDPNKDIQVGDTVVVLVKDDPRFPKGKWASCRRWRAMPSRSRSSRPAK